MTMDTYSDDAILQQAADWQADGQQVAVATVVNTWGSSPRPVGSQLVINDRRDFLGSVSGGCIEGAVVEEALKVMQRRQAVAAGIRCNGRNGLGSRPGLRRYRGGLCRAGGTMKTTHLSALLAARSAKEAVVLVTQLSTGAQALVRDGETSGALKLDRNLEAAVEKAQTDDRSLTVEARGERYFLHIFSPPRRLIVVGAVHIAQTLVPIASLSGYAVTVVDPRGAFATDARFPGVTLSEEWPDDALTALDPDRRTAVVTLTHDPKLDDPALAVALRSDAFYIGSLGSRRTHARRIERLTELGFNERDFARINGPIGLDIGAVSPAEIAISIMAEITQTLHRPAAEKAA